MLAESSHHRIPASGSGSLRAHRDEEHHRWSCDPEPDLPKGMEYALIDEPKVLTAAEQADLDANPQNWIKSVSNKALGKKLISRLLNTCYRKQGLKDTVIFADQLMYTGFHYAALSGASVGIDDMVIPDARKTSSPQPKPKLPRSRTQFRPVW
jgi:DNA-directed RNA polymerase subunit beta'